jgi:hypothetical protein
MDYSTDSPNDSDRSESLTPVPLLDLPEWSPWPARIMGIESWSAPQRTVAKAEVEYDTDKYARCLDFLESHPSATFETIKEFEFGTRSKQSMLVSIRDELFATDFRTARLLHYESLERAIGPLSEETQTIVELGAGYGFNLHWLNTEVDRSKDYIGGELSANAVKLGNRLASDLSNIRLRQFNFYDPDSYSFLDSLPGPLLIFTCHAVEQLPSAAGLFENLRPYRGRIHSVVHCEPCHQLHSGNLLGQMRSRYAELNDYNRDLPALLDEAEEMEVLLQEPDVFGLNPLNPTSIIQWRYR